METTNAINVILDSNGDIYKYIINPFKIDLECKDIHNKCMKKLKEEIQLEADIKRIELFELYEILSNYNGNYDPDWDNRYFYDGPRYRYRNHQHTIENKLDILIEVYNKYIQFSFDKTIPKSINYTTDYNNLDLIMTCNYDELYNKLFKIEYISYIIIHFITFYKIR